MMQRWKTKSLALIFLPMHERWSRIDRNLFGIEMLQGLNGGAEPDPRPKALCLDPSTLSDLLCDWFFPSRIS